MGQIEYVTCLEIDFGIFTEFKDENLENVEIFSGSNSGSISTFYFSSFQEENSEKNSRSKRIHKGMINGLVLSPNGVFLASCSNDSSIALVKRATLEQIWSNDFQEGVTQVVWHGTSSYLVGYCQWAGRLKVVSVFSGNDLLVHEDSGNVYRSMVFSQNDSEVLVTTKKQCHNHETNEDLLLIRLQ